MSESGEERQDGEGSTVGENRSCPACGETGMTDMMIDTFAPDGGVSVTTAVCENRNCRVQDYYVPRGGDDGE